MLDPKRQRSVRGHSSGELQAPWLELSAGAETIINSHDMHDNTVASTHQAHEIANSAWDMLYHKHQRSVRGHTSGELEAPWLELSPDAVTCMNSHDMQENTNALTHQAHEIGDEERIALPPFQPAWEPELREMIFAQARPLLRAGNFVLGAATIFISIFNVYQDIQSIAAGTFPYRPDWVIYSSAGLIFAGLTHTFSFVAMSIPQMRKWSAWHFESTVVMCCVFTNCGLAFLTAVEDIRLAKFQGSVGAIQRSISEGNVTYGIDWSASLPRRSCVDDSEEATLLTRNLRDPGCLTSLFNCTSMGICFLCCLAPALLQVSARCALGLTIFNVAFIVAMAMMSGGLGVEMLVSSLMQLVTGCITAYLCHVQRGQIQRECVYVKSINFVAEQNRSLLHTLIPPSVLKRLNPSHDGNEPMCYPVDFR